MLFEKEVIVFFKSDEYFEYIPVYPSRWDTEFIYLMTIFFQSFVIVIVPCVEYVWLRI